MCTRSQVTVVLRVDGPLVEPLRSMPNVRVLIYDGLPILARKFITPRGIFSLVGNLFKFKHFCLNNQIFESDVIYLNTIATAPILAYFGSKYRRVVHLHETIDTSNVIYRTIARYILRRADYVICVSNAVLKPIARVCGKWSYKLRLLYNGIEVQSPTSKLSLPPIEQGKIIMALIGRIKPQMKGQNMLIDAISLLPHETLASLHILIVGSTVNGQQHMLTDLYDYIARHNLEDHISVLPFMQDIGSIYKICDAILVPSLCEDSLPTTVLEAMYFGLPVIGTISGGIPEMVEQNISGILLKKNDTQALSLAIKKFIDHPAIMRQMGANGQQIFNKKFTCDHFRSNYSNILKEIL